MLAGLARPPAGQRQGLGRSMIPVLSRIFGSGGDPAQPTASIPADLAAAIESCTVTWRSSRDDDGEPRCVVRVVGVGSWTYSGTTEAAERFQRIYDLPEATARKAARLLASVLAGRNRDTYRRQRPRSWTFDF